MSKPTDQSLQEAAQCWCDPETSHIVMDVELAVAFAKRLDALKVALLKQAHHLADASSEYKKLHNNYTRCSQSLDDICQILARERKEG